MSRIEHLGLAVASLEGGLALYRDLLGFELTFEEEIPSDMVKVAGLDAGGTVIELLEPTHDDSPVARFLARRGPGLHHIALEVSDLAALLPRLKAAGVKLIDEVPRPGSRDTIVAFIHPKSAHGVLIELLEHVKHVEHTES